MNEKGDVERYILWFIILAILVVLLLIFVYAGAWNIVRGYVEEKLVYNISNGN